MSGARKLARFLSRVRIERADECWPWLGRLWDGYGEFDHGGKTLKAHRAMWEFFIGPIPAGLCCLHECDFRACVNLRHLWLGTRAENNVDRAAKGRNADTRGENHPSVILAASAVRSIRVAYELAKSGRTNARIGTRDSLALAYGVSPATISAVVSRKRWSHI